MVAAQASSHSFPEFMHGGEALAEGLLATWRGYGHDMLQTDSGTATLAQARSVGVACCGTCIDARGITEEMLTGAARCSALAELTEWTLWADKVRTF